MSNDPVHFERVEDISIVTLNEPRTRNAMSGPMLSELLRLLTEASEASSIWAMLLTGSGDGFCSGPICRPTPAHASKNNQARSPSSCDGRSTPSSWPCGTHRFRSSLRPAPALEAEAETQERLVGTCDVT